MYALSLQKEEASPPLDWVKILPEAITSMIPGDDRLFVSTAKSKIYCYAKNSQELITHPLTKIPVPASTSGVLTSHVNSILKDVKDGEGFCVVLGIKDGQWLDAFLKQSKMTIIAMTSNQNLTQSLKIKYDRLNLYGNRIVIHHGDEINSGLPPYLATVIVTETPKKINKEFVTAAYGILRPYGGKLCLPTSKDQQKLIKDLVDDGLLKKAGLSEKSALTFLRREGALQGSADWSHEYGDAANTLSSRDKVVKAPLGLLWYGGPSSSGDLYFDRHDWGPSMAVAEGRMYIQGVGKLTAVDVYTGRILWQTKLKKGTLPRYSGKIKREGWSRGRRANWRPSGYHFIVDTSGVYLTYNEKCLILDPQTGKQIAEILLPKKEHQWGRIRIWKNYMVVPVYEPTKEMPTSLFVIDHETHKIIWSKTSARGFPLIAVGGGRIFVYEGLLEKLFANLQRKGLVPKTDGIGSLRAFNISDGSERWKRKISRIVTWISFFR